MNRLSHLQLLTIMLTLFLACESGDSLSTPVQEIEQTEWIMVWNDEFEGSEIDESKWNKLLWKPGHVNNESQAYTNRDTNLFIRDGKLVIRGLIEPGFYGVDYTGTEYATDYTSGRVNTDNKADWIYGRFDIHAKLPKGNGSWPAIWMLGENISSVGWPHCGEIDIMEHVGFDDGNIHGSIHTADYNHMYNTQKSGSKIITTATDTFHTYSLEWSETYLRYLIDNEPFFFVYNDSDEDIGKWPFNAPQYIILNLAIGGDWGGVNGIDPSAFPMEMLVDYVRVYKKSQDYNDVKVTFQVDMENVNVNGAGLYLSGGNISSGQPGGYKMQQKNNSDIWEVTLTLPPNSEFTYKFRNGHFPNSWANGWETPDNECSTGEHNDRFLSVGVNDLILDPVCFGKCMPCE